MSEFKPIPNPYIVGNPIKSRDMFFGRQDDFEYIKRKLQSGVKSYIIVFSGERRSGKTSILFQVLNGELGESFLSILIDMQTMAGLKNENEFFERIAKETFRSLNEDTLNIDQYNFFQQEVSPYKVFSKLLDDIHARYPEKNILFLIDEYELIESKIAEGSLNKNFIPFLAGVLESERKISFLFTGSKKLDERKSPYWNILFAKSLYRNVSFLSKNDTVRLITDPVKEYVTYDEEVIDRIYRLTAGQPFYTQVVCQNIVDHLNEKQKNIVESKDLDEIVAEILENPLPQMIYFWNSLSNEKKLILSFLSEILEDSDSFVQAPDMHKFSRKREFGINLTLKTISTTLETLYHQHLLKKTGNGYSFYMDLFRSWIKQDHSFWQVMKEISTDISGINVEETIARTKTTFEDESILEEEKKSKSKILIPAIGGSLIILAIAGYWLFLKPPSQDIAKEKSPPSISENISKNNERSEEKINKEQAPDLTSTEEKSFEKEEPNKSNQGIIAKSEKSSSRKDALNARKSMIGFKNDALQVGADKTTQFQQGASIENRAERDLKNGKFESASRLFTHASNNYSEAKSTYIQLLRNEISTILQKVNAAKENAQQLNASELASKTFSEAEKKEREGRSLYNQGQYNESKDALNEAERLYSLAITVLNRTSNKLAEEIQTIQKFLKEYKSKSTENYQDLDEYHQAVTAEQQAEEFLQRGDQVNAAKNFQKAQTLYQQAHTKHKTRIKQIHEIIEKYLSALERKDIQQMRRLHANFPKQDQERWLRFFEVVSNLKTSFSVKSLHFEQNSATVRLTVILEYNEAKNSVNWEMLLTESQSDWIISKISEGN